VISLATTGLSAAWDITRCSNGRTPASPDLLAVLKVRVGSDRVVPVAKFRGSTRPVLIAGSKGQISRTLQAAKPFISELRLRGVSVIPLESDAADFTQTLKSLKQEFK